MKNYCIGDIISENETLLSYSEENFRKFSNIPVEEVQKVIDKKGKKELDWWKLTKNHDLSDFKFWDKFEDYIDWIYLCSSRILSHEFIKRYHSKFFIDDLVKVQNPKEFLSIPEIKDMIESTPYLRKILKSNLFYRSSFENKFWEGDWFLGYICVNIKNPASASIYKIFKYPISSLSGYVDNKDNLLWIRVRVRFEDMVGTESARRLEVVSIYDSKSNYFKR